MSSDRRKVLSNMEKKGFTRVREGKHITLQDVRRPIRDGP